ncbi:VolA/Pla-1 family phospholipase [Vibrio lentus]|uniref:Lipase n=1 Tax=Vibrio lentus TaxID=136468 RepID=A0A855IKE6_9VIBR|nr:VolA/Pla-1 family phospholipase [Vibrio lentus]PMJ63031.1 lipase [Vibrio lentus]PMJ81916.1 lipase [Vibrio lentus]PMM54392.1 lipase [Vibrio lentus]PMM55274.1 lipase [Vibrio lentus]PMN37411.1 lipase [Vibrio lentus]
MKKLFNVSLLASAMFLAGCGDDSSSSGASTAIQYEQYIQDSLAQATSIKFQLTGADIAVPLPSFALMDATDGTLGLPTSGDDSLTNPIAAMNTMDGWSTSMPIIMDFEGAGLADGVATGGVYLLKLSGSLTSETAPRVAGILTLGTDFDVQSSASTDTFTIVFKDSLDASSEYVLALSNELTDVNGDPVGMSSSYAALKSSAVTYTEGSLAQAQQVTQGVEKIFAGANAQGAITLDTENIIYSTWFTTESVGSSIYSTKAATASALAQGGMAQVWKGSANPNNIDLSSAYQMTFGTTQELAIALAADTTVDTFMEASTKAAMLAGYTGGALNGTVNVTKGNVKLPYYLETGTTEWNSQPFESGMPSLVKVSSAIADSNEKANMAAQLVSLGIDLTKLATDPAEQLKLVGANLTLSNGNALDTERVITRYAPVPQVKSLQDVEFILFTPVTTPSTPMPIVIYQHGITSLKENAYAFAANLAAQGIAVIGIDMPLHGTRSLDKIPNERSANANLLAYLNLTNLPVARDNVRQSVMDVLGLRVALSSNQGQGAFTSTPLATIDNTTTNHPRLFGHSLGGIVGVTALAQANKTINDPAGDAIYAFSSSVIANSGGQISNLLLGSDSFGGTVIHNVALGGLVSYAAHNTTICEPNSYTMTQCVDDFILDSANKASLQALLAKFAYSSQTVLDVIDPYTNAGDYSDTLPTLMLQADGDETVPNTVVNNPLIGSAPFAGTEPLANKLVLNSISASAATPSTSVTREFIQFNALAKHSTAIAPQDKGTPPADYNHYLEIQRELVDFFSDNKLDSVSNAGSVLE